MTRCMPWYLAVFCRLDSHHHRDEMHPAGRLCRLHDQVMCWWMFRFPRSMDRFNRKYANERIGR